MTPRPGHFVLHNKAVPPLTAGSYVVQAELDLDVASGDDLGVDPNDGHLEVTAPRFVMPPAEILSTFPPANAVGGWNTRLPQIVLKQRTMPWMRSSDDDTPWLALVVVSEREAVFYKNLPVEQCVSAGVHLENRNDVTTGSCIEVSQETIDKVFPTQEEVTLLAHVREVDLADTELALGDDDGFVAVVMANRLPQYDFEADEPVTYRACLISLEGQLDRLAEPPDDDLPLFDNQIAVLPGQFFDFHTAILDELDLGVPTGPRSAVSSQPPNPPATTSVVARSTARPSQLQPLPSYQVGHLTAEFLDGSLIGDLIRGTTSRFPVLAQWSFTCSDSGSFESIMQDLDVGMLGTEPPPSGYPGGTTVEVAETGHVGLDHLTRRGSPQRAWYRGPLSPHRIVREAPAKADDGRSDALHLPLAHTSDQLRVVTGTGRENLSRAAAFEIGRLLTLSNPAVVAAVMRWRREQFGIARLGAVNNAFGTDVRGGSDDLITDVGSGVIGVIHDPPVTFPRPTPPLIPGPAIDDLPVDVGGWLDLLDGIGIPNEVFEVPDLDLGGLVVTMSDLDLQTTVVFEPDMAQLDSMLIAEVVQQADLHVQQQVVLGDFSSDTVDSNALFGAVLQNPLSVDVSDRLFSLDGGDF